MSKGLTKKEQQLIKSLKQIQKYIIEGYGKRCKEKNWDCCVCRAWRLYDELELFLEHSEILEVIGKKMQKK